MMQNFSVSASSIDTIDTKVTVAIDARDRTVQNLFSLSNIYSLLMNYSLTDLGLHNTGDNVV